VRRSYEWNGTPSCPCYHALFLSLFPVFLSSVAHYMPTGNSRTHTHTNTPHTSPPFLTSLSLHTPHTSPPFLTSLLPMPPPTPPPPISLSDALIATQESELEDLVLERESLQREATAASSTATDLRSRILDLEGVEGNY
jgi:hypothetical protein